MHAMKELLKKLTDPKLIKQFASYLIVGGAATLVEWVCFYVLDGPLGPQMLALAGRIRPESAEAALSMATLISTAIAFTIATFANWVLGRLLTFRHAQKKNTAAELGAIFVVSVIGLLANLGLMQLFANTLGWNAMLSKVLATGIVFVWNFLSRKLLIYRV